MSSGRKERYGPEAYAEVIRLISEGRPLTDCLGGPDRPGKTAFYQRLKDDPQLNRDYELALSMRANCRIDALLDVNQRLLEGKIDPQSAACISKNLQWLASREDRNRWGDRQVTELSGPGGRDLIPPHEELSQFEFARLLAFYLGKGTPPEPIDGGELTALPMEASQ